MKTTVEVPDDLYRRVKAEAALRGLKVRELVEDGLRRALKATEPIGREAADPDLTPAARPRRVLDAETEGAARAFLRRLAGRYSVVEAFAFGSRARGAHRSDSDADVAVILEGAPGPRYKVAGEMAAIAFDVMQDTGLLIDPLPIWEDEWRRPETFGNPLLIATIKREGLRL